MKKEMDSVRARIRRMEVDSNPKERERARERLASSIQAHSRSGDILALERSLKTIEAMGERGFFPGKEKAIASQMARETVSAINSSLSREARETRRVVDFSEKLKRLVDKKIVSSARARRIAFSLADSLVSRPLPLNKPISARIRLLDERMRAVSSLFSDFRVPKAKRAEISRKCGACAVEEIEKEIQAQVEKRHIDVGLFEAIDEARDKALLGSRKGDALRAKAIETIFERVERDKMSSVGIHRVALQIEELPPNLKKTKQRLRERAAKDKF